MPTRLKISTNCEAHTECVSRKTEEMKGPSKLKMMLSNRGYFHEKYSKSHPAPKPP